MVYAIAPFYFPLDLFMALRAKGVLASGCALVY